MSHKTDTQSHGGVDAQDYVRQRDIAQVIRERARLVTQPCIFPEEPCYGYLKASSLIDTVIPTFREVFGSFVAFLSRPARSSSTMKQ